jgi:FAD:protein FMN transferase
MLSPTQIQVPQRRVERCMGTVFSIDVRLPGVEPGVVESTIDWLHWVDDVFSIYTATSQISRLDRGELLIDECAPEVREILARCDDLTAATGGYFSARAAGPLDPSGLVKGWAIERASHMLAVGGSTNHCVNGGGDVQCAGTAGPDQPWRIGIADPTCVGQLLAVVIGEHLAVATSGTAERGTHIVDPHTRRRPAALASVTLVGRHLATFDAYATAAFAMGARAPDWIAARTDCSGIVVHPDGSTWTSPGFTTHASANRTETQ